MIATELPCRSNPPLRAIPALMHRSKQHPHSMTLSARSTAVSLDHLVGAAEQRRRHFEAKRFRSLEIDNQLELGWLFDRQIAGLAPFKILST